jgi:D-alanine-D-alanine ligase
MARYTPGHGGRGHELVDYPHAAEADAAFVRATRAAGFEADLAYAGLDDVDRIVDGLDADVVLNLCDGAGPGKDGLPGLEAIAALERRGLPYTGADAAFYGLGCDKVAMKARFVAAGLPTPAGQCFRRSDEPLGAALAAAFPLFVKPSDSGGSAGVDLDSVVCDEPSLRGRLAALCPEFGEVLVEQYVDGREVTVGIVDGPGGPRTLPPLEIAFGAAFPAGRGVRTFAAKYDPESPLYHGFELLCPAPLGPRLERRVRALALSAYRAVEGVGYGRVDLRLDAAHRPTLLEVNPNPSLEYAETGFRDCAMLPIAAHVGGLPFDRLLRRLVADGLRRGGRVQAVGATRRRSARRTTA